MTKIDLQEAEITAFATMVNKAKVDVQTGAALFSIAQKIQQAVGLEKQEALKKNIKKAVSEDKAFRGELQRHIDDQKK